MLIENKYIFKLFEIFYTATGFSILKRAHEIFYSYEQKFQTKKLKEKFFYTQPKAFLSLNEVLDKPLQIKSTNKWLSVAWDVVTVIKNSRKNYIFSRYSNEETLEKNKKAKKGIESIENNLKDKVYTNFDEFEEDITQMMISAERYWKNTKSKFLP